MSLSTKYSKCSADELYDIYEHIDKDVYPDRVKQLIEEIKVRGLSSPVEVEEVYVNTPEEIPPVEFTKKKVFGSIIVILLSGGTLVWDILNGSMSNRTGTILMASDTPSSFYTASIIRIFFIFYFVHLILTEQKKIPNKKINKDT
ncbi:hypothetical protein [Colwellia sp. 12G3]|uniref:hypothetical protein n=1 Tax=Colwellia sp. 12G3 TaxID=2058299 RepID=UPI0012FF0C4C|nr:hypothetical protein [Colwellia sp. 12G3]